MLALIAVALAGPQQVPDYDPARSLAPLVEATRVAVVTVEEGDASLKATRTGSGFLVSEQGYVLTNNHVVELFGTPVIRTSDGTLHEAQLIGTDSPMDIALLRIQGDHPYLGLAESVRVGDRVITMGSPLGLGLSVTTGIVSGTGRDLKQDRFYGSDDYIQTDAAINQGNSGGPLLDLDGHVVGMNTAIIDDVNTVGFAIPAAQLKLAMDELEAHGRIRRGYVGVKARKLTKPAADERGIAGGAAIEAIKGGSPAKKAGLKPGDIITHADGQVIRSDAELMRLVGGHKPGDTVKLDVLRRDQELSIDLVLGDLE